MEKWKAQQKLTKAKDGKADSATPEPADKKSSFSAVPVGKGESSPSIRCRAERIATLPAKPTFSLGGLSRIGLPLKGSGPTPLKRTIAVMDDDEQEDRKLQKLDLPDFDREVQSGEAAKVEAIGDDLAAVDGDDAMKGVEPEVERESDANGATKPVEQKVRMEVDAESEEDDPLDAFMQDVDKAVKTVNHEDAKRQGLRTMEHDDSEDDEKEVKNKQAEEMAKAEATLQYVS